METVISQDGSRIAYDRYGSGPVVILVAGALGYRKFNKMEELAKLLAEHVTVINYDRRVVAATRPTSSRSPSSVRSRTSRL